jgi:xanthine dehydrogenase accessory factor
MNDIFAALAEVVARGGRAALVTIVRARGSTPQRVGAKMLVLEDGTTRGTIGGGCYESDACGKARAALLDGRPALVSYDLNDDFAEESGLVCGGQMDVFIEPIAPPPDLYVAGAGHVGVEVARLAHTVGFRVHVVDDREKFANRDRFPDALELAVAPVPEWLREAPIPRGAYAVIVTRGHRHDLDALRALTGRDLRYLGLIGSRAKVARVFDVLAAEGVPPDRLQQVRAPIGLHIGAVTPEEIAVSIVAELIATRRGVLPAGAGGQAETTPRAMAWTPAVLRP